MRVKYVYVYFVDKLSVMFAIAKVKTRFY